MSESKNTSTPNNGFPVHLTVYLCITCTQIYLNHLTHVGLRCCLRWSFNELEKAEPTSGGFDLFSFWGG